MAEAKKAEELSANQKIALVLAAMGADNASAVYKHLSDDEIEALGGRIYRMPPIRPWTAGEYRKTVQAFYAEHPEYRVIHSHMSELGYYDFREAEKAGVPVRICHAHNRPYGIDLKSPVRWYYKAMMRPHITDLFNMRQGIRGTGCSAGRTKPASSS